MIHKFYLISLLSAFFLNPVFIVAAEKMDRPQEVIATLEHTIDTVVSSANKKENDLEKKKQLIALIIPLFDFNRMTALAIGLPWRDATVEQKIALKEAFQDYLINSYYKALSQIKGERVHIQQKPLISEGGEGLIVRTFVELKQGKSLIMDYALHRSPSGYRIYNVTVAGMSLVTAYRGEFKDIIRTQGIEGLIAALKSNKIGLPPQNFTNNVDRETKVLKQETSPPRQSVCDSRKNRFILLSTQQIHSFWLDTLLQAVCAQAIPQDFQSIWKELM